MFQHIFLPQTDQQKQTMVSNQMRGICADYYSSLSQVILALSSAVTNLPNKTLIFHDFQGTAIKFHDFPCFPWPVRTLEKLLQKIQGYVLAQLRQCNLLCFTPPLMQRNLDSKTSFLHSTASRQACNFYCFLYLQK